MVELLANSAHQTPHSVVSDLGLHCLPVTLLGVSSLQWVNLRKHVAAKLHVNMVCIIIHFTLLTCGYLFCLEVISS